MDVKELSQYIGKKVQVYTSSRIIRGRVISVGMRGIELRGVEVLSAPSYHEDFRLEEDWRDWALVNTYNVQEVAVYKKKKYPYA